MISAAGWRIWHLIAVDSILDPVRERTLFRNADGGRLITFVECPYCLGFWVTGVVWTAWAFVSPWTLVVVAPFALHTGMLAIEKLLSPGE